MRKIKTPTTNPLLKRQGTKKAAIKKKGKIPYAKWLQTAEAPGSNLDFRIEPPSGETRISELEAENYALKALLSNNKPEQMPQLKGPVAATQSSMLDVLLGDMDKNISRFYNALNTLDSFADRLKSSDQSQMPIGPMQPPPPSVISRMERLLSDFNHLNCRLEATNNYLSEIV